MIWAADCETDPFKEGRLDIKPFIWGCYNGSEYHEFDTTKEFVEFITEAGGIVYAHNGGKFDWHFIFEYIPEFTPIKIISGRVAQFKIGNAEFRDSYSIIPVPLAAYKKDDMDYSLMERGVRDKPKIKKMIRDYLRSDCVYLFDLVSGFINEYGKNLTLAGAAMKQWRKISGEKAPRTSQAFYNELSKFYYGGRTQCFKTGEINKPFTVLDIKSAYPDAMTRRHPYGSAFFVDNELPKTEAYIQRSFIELRCKSRGALPWRCPKSGSLKFPNNDIERHYCISGWEYLAALDTNSISDIEIMAVYQFADSIEFSSYVDHFYTMKDEAEAAGDKARYIFSKLFLNSLYGKFGANPENYSEYLTLPPEYIEAARDAEGFHYCADMGNQALVSRPLPEEKSQYYNVAVAASITGYVRAKLWRAISKCDGVLYCDTDSIFACDIAGLELGKNLGDWDIEDECIYGAFGGKKLYAVQNKNGDWKTASKGVRLEPDEIIKVAKGETVEYTPIAPSFSVKNEIRFISRKVRKTVDTN